MPKCLMFGKSVPVSAIVFGVIVSGSAMAQDLTIATSGGLDWSGAYAGGSLAFASGGVTAVPIDQGDPENDLQGFMVGGLAGYNFQRGNLVYGVEGKLSLSRAETGSTAVNCSAVHCEYVDLNWMASLSGRLGLSVNRTLFYGSLGVATADVRAIDWDAGTDSEKHRHSGYVVGLGAEYSLSDKMSAKVEYNYTNFDAQTYNLGTPDAVEFDLGSVEFGLNFHF